jgi:hypothetical protein
MISLSHQERVSLYKKYFPLEKDNVGGKISSNRKWKLQVQEGLTLDLD